MTQMINRFDDSNHSIEQSFEVLTDTYFGSVICSVLDVA
jgi:hypothetical protein